VLVDSEQVGAAEDDQRDPGGDLGGDHRALLASAAEAQVERGRVVRLDSTVTAALVHEPSDSSLLWDAVRAWPSVEAGEALGAGIALPCRDHQRAAKKRARDIQYTRGRPKRLQLYRELIKITQPPWPICTTLRCSWLEQWVWRSSSGRPRSANIGPYRADHRPD
jgi:hypothetical protein